MTLVLLQKVVQSAPLALHVLVVLLAIVYGLRVANRLLGQFVVVVHFLVNEVLQDIYSGREIEVVQLFEVNVVIDGKGGGAGLAHKVAEGRAVLSLDLRRAFLSGHFQYIAFLTEKTFELVKVSLAAIDGLHYRNALSFLHIEVLAALLALLERGVNDTVLDRRFDLDTLERERLHVEVVLAEKTLSVLSHLETILKLVFDARHAVQFVLIRRVAHDAFFLVVTFETTSDAVGFLA